jgi:hypothetical protein
MKRETEYNTIEDNRFEGRLIKWKLII